MARLRRDTLLLTPPLRIFATGAVFVTHTLVLPTHPLPASVSRAQSVFTSRGGAAAHVLAVLAQLAATVPELGVVEPMLVASLGGIPDATRLRDALETVGVRTKYCKLWPGLGVPTAWVVHARDTDTRTVINHNPLPEVSHEDFITLLGPLLAPENYVGHTFTPSSTPSQREQQSPSQNALAPRPSTSTPASSPAPFDWLHLEGRSVRTTIANLVGVDGLARERKWRTHCVISIDLGRRARDGVEALIPHADVIFLTTTTFPSAHPASPRAILLSLARHAPSHALLVLNAGREGAALLSLPTSEYLQSSGWARPRTNAIVNANANAHSARVHSVSSATTSNGNDGVESVRSGSDFWAGADVSFMSAAPRVDGRPRPSGESFHPLDDDEDEDDEHVVRRGAEDARRTPQPQSVPLPLPQAQERVVVREGEGEEEEELDEEGAHAAFVAGMIWALSRRVLPGPPYVPGLGSDGDTRGKDGVADVGIRWRLEECLRFATELACRKAYSKAEDMPSSSSEHAKERNEWDGLGDAMRMAGWFD